MFFTLLIGLLLLCIIWDYFNKKHRNDVLKQSGIHGRPALPLVGNAIQMRGLNSESIINVM